MLDVEATVVGGAFQSHSGSPLSVLCPDWSSPIGKPARYLRDLREHSGAQTTN